MAPTASSAVAICSRPGRGGDCRMPTMVIASNRAPTNFTSWIQLAESSAGVSLRGGSTKIRIVPRISALISSSSDQCLRNPSRKSPSAISADRQFEVADIVRRQPDAENLLRLHLIIEDRRHFITTGRHFARGRAEVVEAVHRFAVAPADRTERDLVAGDLCTVALGDDPYPDPPGECRA